MFLQIKCDLQQLHYSINSIAQHKHNYIIQLLRVSNTNTLRQSHAPVKSDLCTVTHDTVIQAGQVFVTQIYQHKHTSTTSCTTKTEKGDLRMAQLYGLDRSLFIQSVQLSGIPQYSTFIFSTRRISDNCLFFSSENM